MPAFTLGANGDVRLPFFPVPERVLLGASRNGTIHYSVESEYPVNIYIADHMGLAEFAQGVEFLTYDARIGVMAHNNNIVLPLTGQAYYLIIVNTNPYPIAVYYQLT